MDTRFCANIFALSTSSKDQVAAILKFHLHACATIIAVVEIWFLVVQSNVQALLSLFSHINFGRSFTSYSVAMIFLFCIFSAKVDSMVGLKLTNLQVLDEWKLLCRRKMRIVEINSQFSPLFFQQCSKRLGD